MDILSSWFKETFLIMIDQYQNLKNYKGLVLWGNSTPSKVLHGSRMPRNSSEKYEKEKLQIEYCRN